MKSIGITCTTVFHYVHFSGIANELRKLGFGVEYVIYTPYHINERVNRLEEVFNQKNEPYCGFETLFNNEKHFDVLLAPYYMPAFQLLNKEIVKVRCLYGYAKDSWNYAEWNKGFDAALSYGPYATERLQPYTEVVEIGHPRWDQEYATTIIDICGKALSREVLNDKKTLVYCPTWADLSSLDTFMDSVYSLTESFNVIVKLHHGNVLSGENDKWEALKQLDNLYLYDEYTNLFDLLQFADIVLSDYSGAIFDAMLFKKPIVLLDTIDEGIIDTGAVNLNKMANISLYNNADFSNKSLDIQIRDILPHVRQYEQLTTILNEALQQSIAYEHLLPELYAFMDGRANERAAKAIQQVAEKKKVNYDDDSSFHILNEEVIHSFIEQHEELHIWGAGLSGQILAAWLQGKGKSPVTLVDADAHKQGKTFLHLTIEKPMIKKGTIVTVTGAGGQSIRATLLEAGLQEGIDFISIFK